MSDLSIYQAKREKLRQVYLETSGTRPVSENAAGTGGVDHLAMISSDIERTIEFYTNVLGMRITNIIQNRDEPSSTHIFLDMGGGNMMAFFNFPKLFVAVLSHGSFDCLKVFLVEDFIVRHTFWRAQHGRSL